MSLSSNMQITDQDVRTTSTAQGGEWLGQVAKTSDGRTFTYGKNGTGGGTALAAGKLAQGAVSTANHVNQSGVTALAGALSVTYAVGATAVTQDQYKQGYLVVNDGTGKGQALSIRGNTAAASSGSPTIYLKDAVITATSVSDSKFSLFPHKNSAAIIAAAAATDLAVGVPNVSVADTAYAWFQTGGTCSVLSDGTPALNAGLIASGSVAGAFAVEATTSVTPRLGYTLIAFVDAKYNPAYLSIPC